VNFQVVEDDVVLHLHPVADAHFRAHHAVLAERAVLPDRRLRQDMAEMPDLRARSDLGPFIDERGFMTVIVFGFWFLVFGFWFLVLGTHEVFFNDVIRAFSIFLMVSAFCRAVVISPV